MPTASTGVRRQYIHTNLGADAIEWFRQQFPKSGFNGRFQLGYRQSGRTEIWPLFTAELDRIDDFLSEMHISAKIDYYITANSICGIGRKVEQLFSLHNIVIDVDAHTSENEVADDELVSDFLWRLNRDLFSNNDPPLPSSVVFTGRGLQFWWSIIPMSSKCLPWYQEIRDTMLKAVKACIEEYSEFDCFSVDEAASRNTVGYFRLPGTYNTKAKKEVQILEVSQTAYDTHELIKWAKQWKADHNRNPSVTYPPSDFSGKYTDTDVYILRDIHTMAFFRVQQLIQLRMLRNNDVGEETRNNMCFIAYNAMLPAVGHEKAWDKLLSFNAGFKQPMTEDELHHSIDTARRKGGYHYKNSSILRFLGVTEEEQKQIGMYAPSDPFSPLTRLSPNAARDSSRAVIKRDRDAKIRALDEQGVSRKEIAQQLGITRQTVSSVLGPKPSKAQIALDMTEQGIGIDEIASSIKVSQRVVKQYVSKKKLEMLRQKNEDVSKC